MTSKNLWVAGFVVALLILANQPAKAAWFYQENESAFDENDSVQLAVTVGAYGGFGLRCQGGEMKVVYMISSDTFDADTVDKSNSLKAMKLKIRVDKNEVLDLETTGSVPKAGLLVLASDVTRVQVEQIRDAQKNIAVALSIIGQNYYEDKLAAAGSTAVVDEVIKGCFEDGASSKAQN
jgi:hypothetical protein